MKTFKVFKHPTLGYQAVKIGFSWPGFLFSVIWLLMKKLWRHALVVISGIILLTLIEVFFNNAQTSVMALLIELGLYFLAKTLQNPPSACRGDECMPFAEGYKGGAKTPLSTQAVASLCYNMMHGTEEVESCGLRHGIPSGMVPEISEEDI
jgi:hypothetical protein